MGVKTVSNESGTEILSAIAQNDLKRLKDLLEKKLKTDEKIKKLCESDVRHKQTKTVAVPLMLAVRLRDPAIVRYMLKHGVNPNFTHLRASGSQGRRQVMTPLHVAVDLGNYDVVDVLLSARADCNVRDHNGDTPLHLAVQKADTVLTRTLLSRGAEVNAADKAGNTSLHVAAHLGHRGLISILVGCGADVNLRGVDGALPIQIAAHEGHADSLALFRTADGAAVDTALECFGEGRELGALHLAAGGGHHEAVRELVDRLGADVNYLDSRGNTPLHSAVLKPYNARRMRGRDSFRSTVQMLLERGAHVNVRNTYGDTALHLAVVNTYSKVVELLLKYGASTDVENLERLKPIHLATRDDHITRQMLKTAALQMARKTMGRLPAEVAQTHVVSDPLARGQHSSQHSSVADTATGHNRSTGRQQRDSGAALRARSRSADALNQLHSSRTSRSVRRLPSETGTDVISASSVASSRRRSRRQKRRHQSETDRSVADAESEQDTVYESLRSSGPVATSSRQSQRPGFTQHAPGFPSQGGYRTRYVCEQSYDDDVGVSLDAAENFPHHHHDRQRQRRRRDPQSASCDQLDKFPTRMSVTRRSLPASEISARKKEKKKMAAAREAEDNFSSLSTVTTPTSDLLSDSGWPVRGDTEHGGKTGSGFSTGVIELPPYSRMHSLSSQQSHDYYHIHDNEPVSTEWPDKRRKRQKGVVTAAAAPAKPSDQLPGMSSFQKEPRVSKSAAALHIEEQDHRRQRTVSQDPALDGMELYAAVQKPNTIGIQCGTHSITIALDSTKNETTSVDDGRRKKKTGISPNRADGGVTSTTVVESSKTMTVDHQRNDHEEMFKAERPETADSVSMNSLLDSIGGNVLQQKTTNASRKKGQRKKETETEDTNVASDWNRKRGVVVEKELWKYSESDPPVRQRAGETNDSARKDDSNRYKDSSITAELAQKLQKQRALADKTD